MRNVAHVVSVALLLTTVVARGGSPFTVLPLTSHYGIEVDANDGGSPIPICPPKENCRET